MLEQIDRLPPLTETVYKQIWDRIKSGEWGPGTQLPSEGELCNQAGVGRGSVREALRALKALGLVHSAPGRGTFVREDAQIGLASLDLREVARRSSLKELLELRFVLESWMNGLAATVATEEGIRSIEQAEARFRDLVHNGANVDEIVAADMAFHDAVTDATGNNIAKKILSLIALPLQESRRVNVESYEKAMVALGSHEDILAAIQNHGGTRARQATQKAILDVAATMRIDLDLVATVGDDGREVIGSL